ncbi:DUF3164 family protein [Tenacibaculum jejuense]|uniref:DUF3164 family protein n=1 Tax=Tenacibaculum jejuense TaxID=584609 RepID=A0A238UBD8_9FLAO|nr:DUF3164 family protein [Tenacibaculum jejuense]SNR16523.1 conserved protein of unknown function [Tenacibaculum jejuense]
MNTLINLDTLTEHQLAIALAKKQQERKLVYQNKRAQLEKENEKFCNKTAEKFSNLSSQLKLLKEETIKEANRLYREMYNLNGKKPKDVKSFSRKNKEGNIMITVDYQERIEFTEEANVHINAIKEIFRNKFANRNKGLYNILDGLLIKGNKGEYDPKLLAKARKQVKDMGDEKLIEEFEKLSDCQRVSGSSKYCRVKTRDENNKWKDINIQFSSL